MSYLARTLATAVAIAAAGAIPAQAAEYPDGGSDFASSDESWVGSDAGPCSLDGGIAGTCTTTVQHDPVVGNPAGSISVRMNVTANLFATFTGTGTWTSPPFTITQ